MKQLTLGGVLPASAVAMGCMRLAGAEHSADEIIGTARECGITYFDHADIYGGGECEAVFGEYLANHKADRDKITVQTKCAIRRGFYDFSKEHILNSVEASLKRLQTPYIDVLLLHRPDTLMEPEEVAEAFSLLERQGKVRYFGVSNHNPLQMELLQTAVRQPLFINQLQFSVTEAGLVTSGLNVNLKNEESAVHDGGMLEYARIHNITIQTWSPFQKGFINGPFVGDYEHYPDINKKLDELAEKYGVTATGIAGAWILRHPAKMQLISGSVTPSRIREICAGADVEMSREDWYALYRAAGYCLP